MLAAHVWVVVGVLYERGGPDAGIKLRAWYPYAFALAFVDTGLLLFILAKKGYPPRKWNNLLSCTLIPLGFAMNDTLITFLKTGRVIPDIKITNSDILVYHIAAVVMTMVEFIVFRCYLRGRVAAA